MKKIAIFFTIFDFAMYLLNGFVLKMLWGWYVVPTFHVAPLSLVPAIGIVIIVGFLTSHYVPTKPEDSLKMMYHPIVIPLFALAFGWVIHLFL